MIRLNANGKRLDAWLIYKCTLCDDTWNRPIIERRHVGTVDRAFLAALQVNDPALAWRLAFDVAALRRESARVEAFAEAEVRKQVVSEATAPTLRLELALAVPEPVGMRLDRLLAAELGMPRSRIQDLGEADRLRVSPDGLRALRRPVRDGIRLLFDLSTESEGEAIATAARGRRS
jgi:hypothetical protein